jgi:hypothetical protein
VSGKVIKIAIIGDENVSDSKAYLQKAIDRYSSALSTFQTGVNIKVLEIVKGVICPTFSDFDSRNACNDEIIRSI